MVRNQTLSHSGSFPSLWGAVEGDETMVGEKRQGRLGHVAAGKPFVFGRLRSRAGEYAHCRKREGVDTAPASCDHL